MSNPQYYGHRNAQNRTDINETTSTHDLQDRLDYQDPSRSSDYISRPTHSSSDNIAPRSQPNHYSSPSYSDYRDRSLGSDYIVEPVESRSDYIAPYSTNSNRHSRYDDRYTASSRSRSPDCSASSRNMGARSVAQDEGKSNYQILKDGNWDNKHDFMRGHGLKTWEDDDYQEANQILDKYREVDAQSACASNGEYHERSRDFESLSSDPGYHRSSSRYEDEEKASDIESCRSGTHSNRESCAPSSARSGFASVSPVRCGSEYEDVPATHDEEVASESTRSGTDCESVDGHSIVDGSDIESSDDNGIAEGSDYVSSDEGQNDAGSGECASDGENDRDDCIDDDQEDCIEDDCCDDEDD
ncbi:hypothetical protein EJ02DRAFT_238224 [Clathrospora elynae]|uniref:Uncharacterized protein n=1 Tax=Clathrospora elynae TaxID=706981 RepID=A0A6A5SHR9_9PLEO|nr:hypothetical protein EJ02DRAFT_238224 [Clathrospora elynae]